MKEQFVPYEIALKLRGLGFDEPCFGYYTIMKDWMMKGKYSDGKLHFHGPNWANNDNTMRFMYVQNSFGDRDSTVKNSKFTKAIYNIAVPLWQQVIDWFLINYNIWISVDTSLIKFYKDDELQLPKFQFIIEDLNNRDADYMFHSADEDLFYFDYKEAREQAILKAIELIFKHN